MIRRLALITLLLANSLQVGAQQSWSEEYAKRIRATEEIAPQTDTMFGDSIKLFDGSLSFSTVDVSVPGNSQVPVEFRRTMVVSDQSYPNNMGDWQIDVPYIGGIYEGSHANQLGCDKSTPPFIMHPSNQNIFFYPKDYWSGTQLHVNGGSEEMLVGLESWNAVELKVQKPLFSHSKWRTKSNWAFTCLPSPLASSSSHTAQGFYGYAPDGLRYTFNWRVVRDHPPISRQLDPYHAYSIPRIDVRLYATKVEDRFGNYVTYGWQGNDLMSITGSDGRSITLTYNHNYFFGVDGNFGRLSSVSSHGRTWSFGYSGALGGGMTLSLVTNPDASTWNYTSEFFRRSLNYKPGSGNAYQLNPLKNSAGANLVCSKMPDFADDPQIDYPGGGGIYYVTHPAGATAAYYLEPQRHGRANVTLFCNNLEADDTGEVNQVALAHDVLSVYSKQISGPGITPEVYSYAYEQREADFTAYSGRVGYVDYNPPHPLRRKKVTLGLPDGSRVIHWFGKDYQVNEGRLLQSVVQAPITFATLETVDTTYIPDPEALNHTKMPERMGKSLAQGVDTYSASVLRPVVLTTRTRDGVTFSNAVPTNCHANLAERCVDEYAQTVAESKTNTLGWERDQSYTFENHRTLWVHGARKTVKYGSAWFEQVTFDPATSLPVARYDHGSGVPTESYSYHTTAGQAGMLLSVVDGLGNTTWLSSWKRGIPQTIEHPATSAHGTKYDTAVVNDRGLIDSTMDELGYQTTYGYDSMGRLASVNYPTGDSVAWAQKTFTFTRNPSIDHGLLGGHWRHSTVHGNYRRDVYYDGFWRPVLTREYDNANIAATMRYTARKFDHANRETFVSQPVPSASTYTSPTAGVRTTYDAIGRVRKVAQDHGTGTYDTNIQYLTGFQKYVQNPRNKATTYNFQVFDDPDAAVPTTISQPEGVTTTISRNVYGAPTSIQRSGTHNGVPVSATRSFVYDSYQRLCKRVDPESKATLFSYDNAGRLSWKADGSSLTTTVCNRESVLGTDKISYSYDQRNRLLSITYPSGTLSTSRTYYADGALNTSTGGGSTWTYSYNKRRLITQEQTNVEWMTFNHGYDTLGNSASTQYPTGFTVNYSPNALGQPTQASGFASNVLYHPNGQVMQLTYGNGIVRNNTLNGRGMLERSRDTYLTNTVFHDFQYAYDANGNVSAITDHDLAAPQNQNRSMLYDDLDRLTSVTGSTWEAANYGYDPLDNIRYADVGTRQHRYIYDPLGSWRLTSITDPSNGTLFSMGYDDRGNMTSRSGRTLTFDRASRLTYLCIPAHLPCDSSYIGPKNTYHYDGNERRIAEERPTGSLYTLYTLDGLLRGGPNSLPGMGVNLYNIYLGTTPVGIRTEPFNGGGGTNTFLHTDALGSAVVETSASRAVLNRTTYEPYGMPTNRTVEGIGYTGHKMDSDTGLTYMQARYYDGTLGRFLSVDPVDVDAMSGDNFNRYWYANDNPYRFADPDGRNPWEFALGYVVGFGNEMAGGVLHNSFGAPNSASAAGFEAGQTGGALFDMANPKGLIKNGAKVLAKEGGQLTSRAARREAQRKAGVPTSRSATSQSGGEGRRQVIVEGADGKPKVVTQHPPDKNHANPHWHAADAKTDPVSGEVRTNRHGQVKYESDGPAVEYKKER